MSAQPIPYSSFKRTSLASASGVHVGDPNAYFVGDEVGDGESDGDCDCGCDGGCDGDCGCTCSCSCGRGTGNSEFWYCSDCGCADNGVACS